MDYQIKIWSFNEENFDLKLDDNQFVIKNEFISLDPAMRGWLNDARSYIKPVNLEDVMRAGTVGKIIKSNNKYFNEEIIWLGGVQNYTITNGENFQKINDDKVAKESYLGVLGMPGFTAYFGILREGQIKEGNCSSFSSSWCCRKCSWTNSKNQRM